MKCSKRRVKLELGSKNDFAEQITISYWRFYALLNNRQFMKTKFHKYCSGLLGGDFCPTQEKLRGSRGVSDESRKSDLRAVEQLSSQHRLGLV